MGQSANVRTQLQLLQKKKGSLTVQRIMITNLRVCTVLYECTYQLICTQRCSYIELSSLAWIYAYIDKRAHSVSVDGLPGPTKYPRT